MRIRAHTLFQREGRRVLAPDRESRESLLPRSVCPPRRGCGFFDSGVDKTPNFDLVAKGPRRSMGGFFASESSNSQRSKRGSRPQRTLDPRGLRRQGSFLTSRPLTISEGSPYGSFNRLRRHNGILRSRRSWSLEHRVGRRSRSFRPFPRFDPAPSCSTRGIHPLAGIPVTECGLLARRFSQPVCPSYFRALRWVSRREGGEYNISECGVAV